MADTVAELLTEQEVSGQVLLWAILAMSFSNMAQPSQPVGTGLTLFDPQDRHQGLLDTGLSSPVFCLMDSSLQFAAIVGRFWTGLCGSVTSQTLPNPVSGAVSSVIKEEKKDVAIRLVSFVLAVLPQAVKIFGMRGIAATQGIAAILLFTATVQIMSASTIELCRHERQVIEDWLARDSLMKDVIKCAVIVAHGALYTFAWLEVAKTLSVTRTPTTENTLYVVMDIAVLACFLSSVLILPWAARVYHMRLLRLWPYRLSPFWISFGLWHVMAYPGLLLTIDDLKKQGLDYPSGAGPIMTGVIPPAAVAALGSYGIAWALSKAVRFLFPERHASQQAAVPVSNAASVYPVDSIESHVDMHDSDHARIGDVASPLALGLTQTTQQSCTPNPTADTGEDRNRQSPVTTGGSAAAPQTTSTDFLESEQGDGVPDDAMHPVHVSFLVTLSILFEFNLGKSNEPSATLNPGVAPHAVETQRPEDAPSVAKNHTHDRSNFKDVALRIFTAGRPKLAKVFEERSAFGKWVVYSVFFQKFRASIPTALRRAWQAKDVDNQPKTLRARVWYTLWNIALVGLYFGLLMIGFVFLTINNMFDLPSMGKIMRKLGRSLLWRSFALFNLTTAVVYFTVAFDGTGTDNPGWTNVFGR